MFISVKYYAIIFENHVSPGTTLNIFSTVQKSYETKQYKKGLKAADAILKKFPDHGGMHRVNRNFVICHAFAIFLISKTACVCAEKSQQNPLLS